MLDMSRLACVIWRDPLLKTTRGLTGGSGLTVPLTHSRLIVGRLTGSPHNIVDREHLLLLTATPTRAARGIVRGEALVVVVVAVDNDVDTGAVEVLPERVEQRVVAVLP